MGLPGAQIISVGASSYLSFIGEPIPPNIFVEGFIYSFVSWHSCCMTCCSRFTSRSTMCQLRSTVCIHHLIQEPMDSLVSAFPLMQQTTQYMRCGGTSVNCNKQKVNVQFKRFSGLFPTLQENQSIPRTADNMKLLCDQVLSCFCELFPVAIPLCTFPFLHSCRFQAFLYSIAKHNNPASFHPQL